MRHVLLGVWLAACTSSSRPPAQTNVPDRFEQNLDLIVRSVTHPCGADEDNDGDGVVDLHWHYSYDSHGRSKQDKATDLMGAVSQQIDYTWDNAGNLTDELQHFPGWSPDTIDVKTVYDSLGQRVQFVEIRADGNDEVQRETIDYSDYDQLGHPTHGAETIADVHAGTTQTLSRVYGYDGLGRRISLDAHFSTGEVYQAWQHTYDDLGRTVTTTVNEPRTLHGDVGITDTGVDTYDTEFHYLGSHDVSTSLADASTTTIDTVNTWSGDRQLDSTTTIVGPGLQTGDVFTYRYSCGSGREVQGSGDAHPTHARAPRRPEPIR